MEIRDNDRELTQTAVYFGGVYVGSIATDADTIEFFNSFKNNPVSLGLPRELVA